MYCPKCGAEIPDDSAFCSKCGANLGGSGGAPPQQAQSSASAGPILAPTGATSLKCPSCGAPISPKFGEMVITCEYCGSSVSLGQEGWKSIQNHTMLPLKIATQDQAIGVIRPMMDKGLLHRHLQEDSAQEEMSLSYVPYWIVTTSARTTVVSVNEAAQLGQAATTAALMGVVFGGVGGGFGGGFGGRRRAFEGLLPNGLLPGSLLGARLPIGMYGMGMGYGGGMRKTEQMDSNYNFPVIALKALTDYQPKDYQFNLEGRTLFDVSKLPKGVQILNGDISEDVAKSQAKTLVDQLQSQKAHAKYHMIQSIQTQVDAGDVELMHAPIWFAKYDHKGNKIVLVIDANSGNLINSIGL